MRFSRFGAVLLPVLFGCQSKSPAPAGTPSTATADSASLEQLAARVDSLIGDAPCTSVSQCRLIGIGAKPCGGPRGYRVYSVARTDSVALARVAEQFNAREAAINRREGRLSDCSVVTPPTIGVENGHCVLVATGHPVY